MGTTDDIDQVLTSRDFDNLAERVARQAGTMIGYQRKLLESSLRSGRMYFEQDRQMRINPTIPQVLPDEQGE